jgi:signal transduction histidine kinase
MPAELRQSLERHEEELSTSLRRARQAETIRIRFSGILAGVAAALAVLVAGGAVRLAGHLSRQLSRPIDELVDWTLRLRRREPLPDAPPPKGAPEFAVLRDAFRDTAAELERARQREVEAAELRTYRELARQVAHELKNPLTPMRFAVERLAAGGGASPQQQELLAIIEGESERIERLARDFTALGRLPEGPAAPVDLAELLEELVRAAALSADVSIRVDRAEGVPMITGHYEPLRRAFHNLVLNAADAIRQSGDAKARGERGEIVLGVRPVTNGAAAAVEVTVSDNGVGIAPEHLPRVFEPYMTTKTHGTGLGLAIVRQTVRDHGGTIRVDSEPGRGATFTVVLPVEQA